MVEFVGWWGGGSVGGFIMSRGRIFLETPLETMTSGRRQETREGVCDDDDFEYFVVIEGVVLLGGEAC